MNLDESLQNLENKVMAMSDLVLAQHRDCVKILENEDKDLALEIVKNDQYVNKLEEEINNLATELFALLGPVASDLRRVLVAIKIASELERIGDYAKSLAGFVIKNKTSREEELMEIAHKMEERFIAMLTEAMEAYTSRDVEKAFTVAKYDDKIEELYEQFKLKVTENSSLDANDIFYLARLVRNVQRSGDHTINICEHVVYLVKGIQYDFD